MNETTDEINTFLIVKRYKVVSNNLFGKKTHAK